MILLVLSSLLKNWFSFKDLLIHNDNIFVSFTEELKKIVGTPV